jgi:hypothetical protein
MLLFMHFLSSDEKEVAVTSSYLGPKNIRRVAM